MFRRILYAVALVAGFASMNAARAEDVASTSSTTVVHVGLYLTQVFALNVKDNNFTADFYVWFRWDGSDDLRPLDSFEISNGKIETKNVIETKKTGATNYACARVTATVVEFFQLQRFPLDEHTLAIEIEDSKDAEQVVKFVNDEANTRVDPRVQIRGFKITHASSEIVSHVYRTNYGDTSLPTENASRFSRFVFKLELERPGYSFLLKLYWTVFLSTLIGLLAFRVKPNDLDPRFGLGVGAIFACAASTYVISSYLPDTDYLTLADKLNFLAVSFIFGSILQSTIALRYHVTGREHVAEKLDFYCFWGMLVAYAVLNVTIVLAA